MCYVTVTTEHGSGLSTQQLIHTTEGEATTLTTDRHTDTPWLTPRRGAPAPRDPPQCTIMLLTQRT